MRITAFHPEFPIRSRLAVMALLPMVLVSTGFAQDTTAKSATASQVESPEVPVTRADLGWAYLRVEQTFFANLPDDEDRVIEINQAFDAATRNFFSGKYAKTIAEINEISASLLGRESSLATAVALSLKPTIDPSVVRLDQPQPLKVRLTSIYPTDLSKARDLKLSLRPVDSDQVAASQAIELGELSSQRIDQTVAFETASLDPGAYAIVVSGPDEPGIAIGQFNVVSKSLDQVRAENTVKLDQIAEQQASLASAIAACRSRNELLQDKPSEKNSSQFLSDLEQLANQIADEIEVLADGRSPFHRRAGDYWRTFAAAPKDQPVPCRVYAPESVIGDKPVPLVVVLHGAGGDENMFFAGYGAGRIKQLADQHGFVVVSPATRTIGARSARFDAMVSQISDDYAIDSNAIYVLGHSMGGFTTVSIASRRGDSLAAACCLAGGANPGVTTIPPLLMIGAELDAIVPTGMLEIGAKQAKEAGLPVKFQQKANYGHTLMVGAVLDEAIDWLLKHRLGEPAPTK